MTKLKATRQAQYVLAAEFTFNFDDTLVNTSGAEVDGGKTNTAATSVDIIELPYGATIVGGEVVTKAGSRFPFDADLLVDGGSPYVSRAGEKLAGALDDFGVEVSGRDCLDAGASTGGFTDVLLQKGVCENA